MILETFFPTWTFSLLCLAVWESAIFFNTVSNFSPTPSVLTLLLVLIWSEGKLCIWAPHSLYCDDTKLFGYLENIHWKRFTLISSYNVYSGISMSSAFGVLPSNWRQLHSKEAFDKLDKVLCCFMVVRVPMNLLESGAHSIYCTWLEEDPASSCAINWTHWQLNALYWF